MNPRDEKNMGGQGSGRGGSRNNEDEFEQEHPRGEHGEFVEKDDKSRGSSGSHSNRGSNVEQQDHDFERKHPRGVHGEFIEKDDKSR